MKKTVQSIGILLLLLASYFYASPIHAQEMISAYPEIPIAISNTPSISPLPELISEEIMGEMTGSVLGASTPSSIQMATFLPGEPNWRIDPEVTQVGRNAERARQFIYWVITHGPSYNARVLSQVWAVTRNIAYILMAFVIVGLALQLILRKTNIGPTFTGISIGYDRVTLLNIVVRVVSLLLFITFSYLIVLGLIQLSEILSRFFIERFGGEDLFNIVFSGSNAVQNYQFVGYRNMDPLEQDMVYTSLFLVRFTSFTYNFMGIILIMRQVILMFLLIISPFLALLLPFIFIRNTGYIWIGEFFRWLFYGPLFALFIAALATIWKAGIPYAFDFVPAENGTQVYATAINILYGGPAQSLNPTNTSNYVDTYTEYVIALIMLWTAILLPWFLLRIFRDYCCDILEKNQGVLMQILDKMRNIVPPPKPPKPPSGPTEKGTFGKEMKLPTQTNNYTSEHFTKEQIIEKINEREIHKVDTNQITRAFDLHVSSIKDIARIDTKKDTTSAIRETLTNIENPYRIQNPQTRAEYEALRNEFTKRASTGDNQAKQVIAAATPKVSQLTNVTTNVSSQILKEAMQKPGVPVIVPQIISTSRISSISALSSQEMKTISEKTKISEEKVNQVIKAIPLAGTNKSKEETITSIAQKANASEEEVKQVLENVPAISSEKGTIQQMQKPSVTIEEYEEVRKMWMNHYRKSEVPVSDTIKSRDAWIQDDVRQLTNTIDLLTSVSVKDRQKGMNEVASILPFMMLGGFTDLETLTYIKAKLEAAKLVQDELEHVEEAKEEIQKDDEEMISIPVTKPVSAQEHASLSNALEMNLPENENKDNQAGTNKTQINPANVSTDPDTTQI